MAPAFTVLLSRTGTQRCHTVSANSKQCLCISLCCTLAVFNCAGNARTYTIVATGELNYDTSSTLQHRSYNAEYVDVVHDGATGIRATSNSMDMGSRGPGSVASSGRGPSSIAGSLGGFAGAAGGSPRSPLAPHLWGQLQAGRAASAPPGVAAAAAAVACSCCHGSNSSCSSEPHSSSSGCASGGCQARE